MSNIKWNKKLRAKTNGVRKVEILLKPSSILGWVKFILFRQDYWSAIKNVSFFDSFGSKIEPGYKDRQLSLSGHRVIEFYETRAGDYVVDCEIDPKCEGWYLDFNIELAQN